MVIKNPPNLLLRERRPMSIKTPLIMDLRSGDNLWASETPEMVRIVEEAYGALLGQEDRDG